MILVLDNYDSFTHNLVQLLGALGADPLVVRNDARSVEECVRLAPEALVVSPGPGGPADAGISLGLVRRVAGTIPILGVCLGHQVLAAAWGGRVTRARAPLHGRASEIRHTGRGLFADVPSPCPVARYHSLAVDPATLPARFTPTAWTDDGALMAIEDAAARIHGVQFHPESFLTPHGSRMIHNFLSIVGAARAVVR